MEKALIIDVDDGEDDLNQYLTQGWKVKMTEPFGDGDYILVILEKPY